MDDFFAPVQAPATNKWRAWSGAVLLCYCKLLEPGEPRLVALYFRLPSVTRCIVRLEWRDGNHWVRSADDAPWHVHASGPDASREWADFYAAKVALEWRADELAAELADRRCVA